RRRHPRDQGRRSTRLQGYRRGSAGATGRSSEPDVHPGEPGLTVYRPYSAMVARAPSSALGGIPLSGVTPPRMNLRVTVITLYVDDLERALRGSPRACGDRR